MFHDVPGCDFNLHKELIPGNHTTGWRFVISPQPTKAIKKRLDSSARNPLIYIGVKGESCGLRAVSGRLWRRDYWTGESKRWQLRAMPDLGRSPQESAGIPMNTRDYAKKNQPETRLVFQYGGAGGN